MTTEFTAFDGWRGSFAEVFSRNQREIDKRIEALIDNDGMRSKRRRLECAVVNAAKRRRKAHAALHASIKQGMPVSVCHEYDAANEHYESALDALEEFEAKQK